MLTDILAHWSEGRRLHDTIHSIRLINLKISRRHFLSVWLLRTARIAEGNANNNLLVHNLKFPYNGRTVRLMVAYEIWRGGLASLIAVDCAIVVCCIRQRLQCQLQVQTIFGLEL